MQLLASPTWGALHPVQRPPPRLSYTQGKRNRAQRLVTQAGLFGSNKQREEEKPEKGQAAAPIPERSPGSFLNKLGPLPLIVIGGVVVWGLIRSGLIWRNVTKTKVPQDTESAANLVDAVATSSDKLDELFKKMDLNKDGRIDLKEVALGLKSVNPRASLSAARKSALDVFLLFDADKNRYLDKDEFSRFIQRFCLLSDSPFEQFADDLLMKLSAPQSLDLTDKKVAQELDRAIGGDKVAEAIADRKLDGIFTVWDEDRDGSIKFGQLKIRLQNYKVSAAGEERTKGMLNSVPSSDDFDRNEFGRFVEGFAKAANTSFADLADYLLVVPLHEFDPSLKIPAK
ncbi:hypothetical protein WJX74_003217 [Apatococcus lobatus]|uniref:EF-hand domain-containing protein n=1 Tax=Apatococcus lobatus TaxID=904363 RepID=A0AAW1RPD1_9CHLO